MFFHVADSVYQLFFVFCSLVFLESGETAPLWVVTAAERQSVSGEKVE